MMKWNKPSSKAAAYPMILGVYFIINHDGETEERIDILYFNSIINRWKSHDGGGYISLSDLLYWLPIPPRTKED